MELVYALPLWLLALCIIGISVAYVVAAVTIVQRSGWTLETGEIGTATVLHAFVSVLYAVALALIVVNVQAKFSAVDDAALAEASKLSDLYRNLDGLEGPDRARLQDEVVRYVDLVIDREWPANSRGEQSEDAIRAVDDLARHVIQLRPATPEAQVVQQAMLEDIHDVLDARRKRLFLGLSSMNPLMWVIIAAGAFITIGFAALFPMRHTGRRIVVLSLAAVMFGLMIILIVTMDQPLRGDPVVEPDAFRMIKTNIARSKQQEKK